jgi:hypothetical protein
MRPALAQQFLPWCDWSDNGKLQDFMNGHKCIHDAKCVSSTTIRLVGVSLCQVTLTLVTLLSLFIHFHWCKNGGTNMCWATGLKNIEPQDLLSVVMKLGFCSEKRITNAITKQALRASQNWVWLLSSGGWPNTERILVEGAGSKNAIGIYYRIDGLANGELYSKRENNRILYTYASTVSTIAHCSCFQWIGWGALPSPPR